MQPIFAFLIYGCVAIGAYLVVDAIAGFIRTARGADDEAVERRLQAQSVVRVQGGEHINVFRAKTGVEAWREYIPFYPRFLNLLDTSGTGMTLQRAVALMAAFSLIALVLLAFAVPLWFFALAIPFAPVIAVSVVLLYLMRARKIRPAKFEEQLPDAIDLIVRSLKIGHPLSGAMAVVGRELPPPICTEFASAFEEVSYGQDIPAAFSKMADRIKLQDLGYFAMAIQIQQESGGNLVESLSKLSAVIRGRFRMFRKVKALTAEGRFSAWFLSLFPLVLIFVIQLIKPDYYTQVMGLPIFPTLVVITIF